MAMSFVREVAAGFMAAVQEEPDTLDRIKKAGRLGGAVLSEVVAGIGVAPHLGHAVRVHRSLPVAGTAAADTCTCEPYGVVLHPSIPYGGGQRQLLDIYVPQDLYARRRRWRLERQGRRAGAGAGGAGGAGGAEPGEGGGSAPVLFFVHGGIWATGDRFHFAPMAVRLAQAGLVVVVISYTLYPEAMADIMAAEALRALLWTLSRVQQYGGDPARLAVAGHSAGGHLGALAVMMMAQLRHEELSGQRDVERQPQAGQPQPPPPQQQQQQQKQETSADGNSNSTKNGSSGSSGSSGGGGGGAPQAAQPMTAAERAAARAAALAAEAAAWLPGCVSALPRVQLFIGMSGIYHVARHHEYEASRGVHQLSTMGRACGGPDTWDFVSPAAILARATAEAAAAAASAGGRGAQGAPASAGGQGEAAGRPPSYYSAFALAGEAVPYRCGLDACPSGGLDASDTLAAAAAASAAAAGRPPAAAARRRHHHLGRHHSMGHQEQRGEVDGVEEPLQQHRQEGLEDTVALLQDFCVEATRQLPPSIFMSSLGDHMVQWHEAQEMAMRLLQLGVPVKHLVYGGLSITHNDFVFGWRPLPYPGPDPSGATAATPGPSSAGSGGAGPGPAAAVAAAVAQGAAAGDDAAALSGLPPFARDLLLVLLGRVRVRFLTSPPGTGSKL